VETAGVDDPLRGIEGEIPALRRYARFLLRDPEAADDLVQDTLLRAVSRVHLWRPGNLRGWLFTILRNLHLNSRRDASRRPTLLPLDDVDEPRTNGEQVSRVEVAEALAAFQRLSEEQREVMFLVVVEGLRYREAAEFLGVQVGTVMSRLARARERLRQLVEEPDDRPRLRRVK
jgi:RNA polymerase sigma-70 factor, ECF subfamily